MLIKLSKAIEILNLRVASPFTRANPDTRDSIKLSIEALKRLQDNRRDPEFDHWIPLPGEDLEE